MDKEKQKCGKVNDELIAVMLASCQCCGKDKPAYNGSMYCSLVCAHLFIVNHKGLQ